MSPVIELVDVKKIYNPKKKAETIALKGVSLKVEKGDFLAIMGRSGSGKSSLMHIIGLLDQHFDGDYRLEGKSVRKLSSGKLADLRSTTIGFIFQQFNLLKRATVIDNVLLPTMYKSTKHDQQRAIKVLKQVGLGDFILHKSNELSGGQMQRVAVARALIMNPKIILADEPTGNLDTKTAHEIMNLFRKLNQASITIVVITHETDIAAFAKRTIHLQDGQIVKGSKL